ncbi:MAG: DNA repair protein RecN [Fimbriimonas sp.]
MISELTVENLAIIERAHLGLTRGFTVLTGETGAGKSLVIDAIELALGGRADTDLVRTGTARASVQFVAQVPPGSSVALACEELGVPLEDGLLIIQRDVQAEGRSQCRIGGRLTTVAVLRQIGKLMVDLHGQHEHQALLDPTQHGLTLDAWIGAPAQEALANVLRTWQEAEAVRAELRKLSDGARDREHRLDLLRFQVEEITAAGLSPTEYAEIESQIARLKYAERLSRAVFSALEALADREPCGSDLLAGAVQSLEDVTKYDASLETQLQPLREASILVEESIRQLRDYADLLEADPALLDEATARLDILKRLRKKYGDNEQAILDFAERAQAELDLLSNAEENLEALQQKLQALASTHEAACQDLTNLRQQVAGTFAEEVTAHLRDLAMNRVVLEVSITPKTPAEDGADSIEFMFSPNPGESPKSLARIASGGELSRVMLSLKAVLAGRAGVPSMVFDEVDAGLSGRAAAAVARKLEELSQHYQIIAISHLPQIAARAHHHYHIEKVDVDGRTVTQVRPLAGDERIQEIARLLAGDEVTPAALENAKEMLRPLNP